MPELIKIAEWSGEKRCNIVFVHGIDGHAYRTWEEKTSGAFWPNWLAEDFEGASIYSYSYESSASKWLSESMSIYDETELSLAIMTKSSELTTAPICFICHSLGGIIVKGLMVSAREQIDKPYISNFYNQVQLVAFIATPHAGSFKASVAQLLKPIFRTNTVVEYIVANSPECRRLNASYRELVKSRAGSIRNIAFHETIGGMFHSFVSPSSADPGLPDCRPLGILADHKSIAKPASRSDALYTILRSDIALVGDEPRTPGTLSFQEHKIIHIAERKSKRKKVTLAVLISVISMIISIIVFYIISMNGEYLSMNGENSRLDSDDSTSNSTRFSLLNCPRPAGITDYDSRHDKSSDPFDGGNWGNLRGGFAWARRTYPHPILIEGIRLTVAGSDITVEGSIIEINLLNGNMIRNIAKFKDKSIGRWDIDSKRTMPPQMIMFKPVEVTGVEIKMIGHGWFSAGDLRVIPHGCINSNTIKKF